MKYVAILFNSENSYWNKDSDSLSHQNSCIENASVKEKEKSSDSVSTLSNFWGSEDQNMIKFIDINSYQSPCIKFSTLSIQKHLPNERVTMLTYNQKLMSSQEKDSQGVDSDISKSYAKYLMKINEWDNNGNEIMINPENYSKES